MDTIPTEIMACIAAQLSSNDLLSLCRVSRGLCSLIQPTIFASPSLPWCHEGNLPLVLLATTVARRPELALHIRQFSFTEPSYATQDAGDVPLPIDMDLHGDALKCLVAAAHGIRHPFAKELAGGLASGIVEALICLVIYYASNLNKLELSHLVAVYPYYTGSLVRYAVVERTPDSSLPKFEKLTTVLIRPLDIGQYARDVENMKNVLSFFYLPAVEELALSIENQDDFRWPGGSPPDADRLRHLELRVVREDNLGEILSCMRNLTSLTWRWVHMLSMVRTDYVIRLTEIGTALHHVSPTLQHLKLEVELKGHDEWDPQVTTTGSLQALRQFVQLETLEAAQVYLMGFSPAEYRTTLDRVLPASLKTLTMSDDFVMEDTWKWPTSEQLKAFTSWISTTPQLEKLVLRLIESDSDWLLDQRLQLTEAGERCGLHIEVVKTNADYIPSRDYGDSDERDDVDYSEPEDEWQN